MSDLAKILKSKQARLGKTSELTVEFSAMRLDDIGDRAQSDTRQLNPAHVEMLAESIALLGLIEPLVVDSQGRLLAGGHRRAAIESMRADQLDIFEKWFADGVPVHRMNFDAELQPDLAIQIEVAENEQRRDYTPTEVRAIADRFKEAGFKGTAGRPSKGQPPLIPALMAVAGKSKRTILRYLDQGEDAKKVSSDTINYGRHLRQAQRSMSKWLQKPDKSEAEEKVAKAIPEVLKLMDAVISFEK